MIKIKDIEALGFTSVSQIDYCQAFIANKNGVQCYLSYETIIGIYDMANRSIVYTGQYYSKTTSTHRNKFIKEFGGFIDDDRSNTLCNMYNLI